MQISRKPLKRVSSAKSVTSAKRKPKPKKKKQNVWVEYGLKKPSYVRYKGRKGVYWWLFSRKIRQRDFEKYGGMCVDQCGKKADSWQEMQAGHFVPASKGFTLLFDERNVNAQLPVCNSPHISPLSPIGYARELDERYGAGTADALMARQHETTKEWTQKEYDYNIRLLLGEFAF